MKFDGNAQGMILNFERGNVTITKLMQFKLFCATAPVQHAISKPQVPVCAFHKGCAWYLTETCSVTKAISTYYRTLQCR